MTTFTIDGPITEIVTKAKFEIISLNGGSNASPAMISPSATTDVLIVLASVLPYTPSQQAQVVFQLSSSFNIGDIVEIYGQGIDGYELLDENGTQIASVNHSIGEGAICRKVATGSSQAW